MPQMAPISWLTLYLMFFIIFMLFNIMNYYNFFSINFNKTKMKIKKNSNLHWKW